MVIIPSCQSSMTTSPCASRCPTCCGSSDLRSRRSPRRKRSWHPAASSETSCLILDIAMPGMTGPDLQQELKRRGEKIPIVFMTAHGGEAMRPRLLEQGAVECLSKPFSDTALRAALDAAMRRRD